MIFVLKFPKIESQCRPNILINSDFKSGIINQKDSTSYTGLGTTLSTIDMWISYGINVGLNATSVRFINRDTSYHTIRQKYDVKLINDEKYTAYMKVINLVGTVYINPKTDKTKLQRVVNGKNIYTFIADESNGVNVQNNEFIIGLEAGAEVEIQCIKLEKGSNFTGMPVWNYTLELLKCQRYFIFKTFIINRSAGNCFVVERFPTTMVKKPVLRTTKCYVSSAGVNTAELSIRSYSVDQNTLYYIEFENSAPFDGGSEIGRPAWCTLELDAYNY